MKFKLSDVLKVAFLGVLVYFCIAFVVPKWHALQLTARLRALPIEWLLAAILVLLLHYAYTFALWFSLLRLVGKRPPLLGTIRAYVLSLLPKYIPGKVFGHGVRAHLSLEAGLPGPVVSSSLVWESVFILGSAAVFGLLGYLAPSAVLLHDATRWLLLIFGLGCGAFLILRLSGVLQDRWTRWVGLPQLMTQPIRIGLLFGLYGANWVLYGVGHWFLARAITPLEVEAVIPLSVALAVSWSVGFLSLIAPAGVGVREGVLYLFVASTMGEGGAVLFVTLSRILAFGVEVLLVGLWGAVALFSPLQVRGADTVEAKRPAEIPDSRPKSR